MPVAWYSTTGQTMMMMQKYQTKLDGVHYAPEEFIATILTNMREMAEIYLKESVRDAVIRVPANFNNAQRKAIKNAAGLNVLRILSEPTPRQCKKRLVV